MAIKHIQAVYGNRENMPCLVQQVPRWACSSTAGKLLAVPVPQGTGFAHPPTQGKQEQESMSSGLKFLEDIKHFCPLTVNAGLFY